MIKFKHVSLSYGPEKVLHEVSFGIKQGEFVLLTGKSGAGKTSIIKLLLGARQPDSGSILVNDLEISKLTTANLQLYRRTTIGVVFQDYKLISKRSIHENVAFALEVCGESKQMIEKKVPEVLKLVGLAKISHKFPDQISGGEAQRVAIARAVVHDPEVLIADEPTGNLDQENTADILNLLKTINERGTTVILATHDQQIVDSLKKRILHVKDGKII
ncbi:MAG: cell division ATP-binding protein FtsE [Candidatus Gracilibacteria bacterium]|nr:cell division ATP-binding protein FtsE [Candidatus Gracilibacteria bacterium]